MIAVTYDEVARVLGAVMATIRDDVAAGVGAEIEADAVVMNVADELALLFAADPTFDKRRFEELADVNDPIPGEAFRCGL